MDTDKAPRSSRSTVGRVVAVVVMGLTLYIVLPALVRVIASWPQQSDTNACSEPELKLAFNADVQASEAERFYSFRDIDGRRVAADVPVLALQGYIEFAAAEQAIMAVRSRVGDDDLPQAIVLDQAPVIPVDYGAGYSLAAKGLLGAVPNSSGLMRYAGLAWAP